MGMGSERPARECPVPKPGGFVGQFMGFGSKKEREGPSEVVVQSLRARRGREGVEMEKEEP